MDNFGLYNGIEYADWVSRENLIPEEKYLLSRFLNKIGKTLEAGTAGGRILLELRKNGFNDLFGFDFVPRFVDEAQKKDADKCIHFSVQNAVSLNYSSEYFQQLIYVQQILCFIEKSKERERAVLEAFRVLKGGGVALFSFLCIESRNSFFLYRIFIKYLSFLRYVMGRKTGIQYMPWLKLGGHWNFRAFLDGLPYVYWYKAQEAQDLLVKNGFKIEKVGTKKQILEDHLLDSVTQIDKNCFTGMIYFVCRKP